MPPTELPDLHRRLVERIEAVPGVTSASLSSNPPFSGARVRSGFEVEGYVRRGDEQLSTQEEQVTIGYFQTVGLRLLQGRAFGPEDTARTRRVSVISATMARRLFPNQEAVGKRWGGSTNFDAGRFRNRRRGRGCPLWRPEARAAQHGLPVGGAERPIPERDRGAGGRSARCPGEGVARLLDGGGTAPAGHVRPNARRTGRRDHRP